MAFLLIFPFLMVLASRLVLWHHNLCRKPLEATFTGVLWYWFLLSPMLLLGEGGGLLLYGYFIVVIWLMVLCEALQQYLAYQFALTIDPTFYAMIFMTSKAEIREFLHKNLNFKVVLAVMSIFVLYLLVIFWGYNIHQPRCLVVGAVMAGLFVVRVVASVFKRRSYRGHRQRLFIQIIQKHNVFLQFVGSWFEYKRRYQRLRLASQAKTSLNYGQTFQYTPFNLLGCVVVGESATRSHHQFYDYNRNTTPVVSKLLADNPGRIIAFDDVIAAIPTTPESFEYIFTRQEIESASFNPQCTLPILLREAGFYQEFHSAQPRFSKYDTSQTLIFSACDVSNSLSHAAKCKVYDEELLNYVWTAMDSQKADATALFLNLYGSHVEYRNRYPSVWTAPFSDKDSIALPDTLQECYFQEWNEYDNTIAYTDYLLGQICARVLAEKERPAFMLYFSDHGEVLPDGKSIPRSRKSHQNAAYDIPFLLAFNDEYARCFPDVVEGALKNRHSPLQMDKIFPGLCHLFGLKLPDMAMSQSFFSKSYLSPNYRTIDLGEVIYQPEKH